MSLADFYLKSISRIFLQHPEDNTLYRLHPISKIVFTVVATAIAVASGWRTAVVTLAILTVTSFLLIDWRRTCSLVVSVLLFVLPMTLFVHVYTILGNPNIDAVLSTSMGMAVAVARVVTMALSFYILFVTTKPQSLARVLSSVGIPYKYSYGFILALRFLSVIAGDLAEILSIQKIRGLVFGRSLIKRLKSYLAVFIPLTISTLMRVDEIALSLEIKGFGYSNSRTYMYTEPLKIHDVLTITLCISIAVAVFSLGI